MRLLGNLNFKNKRFFYSWPLYYMSVQDDLIADSSRFPFGYHCSMNFNFKIALKFTTTFIFKAQKWYYPLGFELTMSRQIQPIPLGFHSTITAMRIIPFKIAFKYTITFIFKQQKLWCPVGFELATPSTLVRCLNHQTTESLNVIV